VTKEPTAKRRSPLEDYLWPIFVAACGNCCVACKATGVPLQRGHVQRHADSGPATLENLMPLCAQCNGKNNKSFNMSDTRPVDWRSSFLKLLAQNLRLKLIVNRGVHPSPQNDKGVQGVDQQNSLHSKEVVGWDAVIFETNSELYTPIPGRPSLVPLAETLATEGFRIISGGTDTHLMLVDVFSKGMFGSEAEKALGEAAITVNKNAIPFDTNPPMKPSGIRVGSPALTTRGMKEAEMRQVGRWIAEALFNRTEAAVLAKVRKQVLELAEAFPLYPERRAKAQVEVRA